MAVSELANMHRIVWVYISQVWQM